MMDFNITDEELNALKIYKEKDYEAINQMLVSNSENDIALLSAEVENKVVSIAYNRESVIEYLKNIKLIYKLILKYFYGKKIKNNKKVFRGTNLSEIERVKSELYIDRFLSATENENEAINIYSANWNRPACMNITLDKNVPYIIVRDILKEKRYKNEVLISPFTRIKYIKEDEEKKLEKNSKILKVYNIEIEKQELDELTDNERNGLYSYILENSYSIRRKLEECIELEKENVINFENIRKLEQLLAKFENEIEEKESLDNYSDVEREEDLDNIDRITKELEDLKNTSTNLFEIRKENINFVNIWKRNIAVYMIASCREIEKAFEFVYSDTISEEQDDVVNENKLEGQVISKSNDEITTETNQEIQAENKLEENNAKEAEKIEDKIETKKINEEENKIDDEEKDKNTKENKTIDFNDVKENVINNVTEVKDKITEKITDEIEKIDVENIKSNIKEKIEDIKEIKDNLVNKISDKVQGFKSDIEEKNSKTSQDTIVVKDEKELKEDLLGKRVKDECKENIESVEKVLDNIKILITKQQNHAKIAGNIGASYSALNNAFEMRKVSETLLKQLKDVESNVNGICSLEESDDRNERLEKISEKNIEISTLLNYLNNPKIAARNSQATRFDEMAIIEENELKRGIAEKIRDVRGEAELKKLKDDLEIIEDKNTFQRFIGIFTGQNKLDEYMIEQIEVRQNAIRKALARKLSLAHNYSIHELMSEISMFINDNDDDELVQDDVLDLRTMADELRRNFVILETRVQSIVYEKEGRNLPLENKKVSKRDILEIETYRFLKKYGYDILPIKADEPKYQDTMASEIARIVEYVNSAGIL